MAPTSLSSRLAERRQVRTAKPLMLKSNPGPVYLKSASYHSTVPSLTADEIHFGPKSCQIVTLRENSARKLTTPIDLINPRGFLPPKYLRQTSNTVLRPLASPELSLLISKFSTRVSLSHPSVPTGPKTASATYTLSRSSPNNQVFLSPQRLCSSSSSGSSDKFSPARAPKASPDSLQITPVSLGTERSPNSGRAFIPPTSPPSAALASPFRALSHPTRSYSSPSVLPSSPEIKAETTGVHRIGAILHRHHPYNRQNLDVTVPRTPSPRLTEAETVTSPIYPHSALRTTLAVTRVSFDHCILRYH